MYETNANTLALSHMLEDIRNIFIIQLVICSWWIEKSQGLNAVVFCLKAREHLNIMLLFFFLKKWGILVFYTTHF